MFYVKQQKEVNIQGWNHGSVRKVLTVCSVRKVLTV